MILENKILTIGSKFFYVQNFTKKTNKLIKKEENKIINKKLFEESRKTRIKLERES